ncbi:TIGR04255 family protein [Nocardia beijingensis]
MYPNREVFPDTPLALVAAEIRFTDSPRLRQQATLDAVALALESNFPYVQQTQQEALQFVVTPGGAAPAPAPSPVVMTNQTTTASVSLTPSSVVYETTAYTEFPDLLEMVGAACRALLDAGVRPAIRRIGLRYIDEVRVPDQILDVREWSNWIDPRLIDHLHVAPKGLPVQTTQCVTTYDLGEGRGFHFRFAAFGGGAVVQPHTLRRPRAFEEGPLFVLDFDGYQEFDAQSAVELDRDVVLKCLTAVHAPAGEAFQNSITDRARELFRGGRS